LRRRKDFIKNRRSILMFIGTTHGIGLTTFAISFANYLSSYERKRTCYVEMNDGTEAITMESDETVLFENTVGFTLNDLDFFPNADEDDLSCIRKMDYDFILIDAGVRPIESIPQNEFDRLFIIGSLRPWKKSSYYAFVNEMKNLETDILQGEFFGTLLLKNEKKAFENKFSIAIKELPLLHDPFRLSQNDINFMKKLMVL